MNQVELIISLVCVLGLAGVSAVVTAMYGLFSPWYSHRTGWGLFTMLASLTVVTWLSAAKFFVPVPLPVIWAAYGLIIAALIWMGAIIGKEQFKGRRHRIRHRKRDETNHPSNP